MSDNHRGWIGRRLYAWRLRRYVHRMPDREWAERMNEAIKQLPQHQQDQLDARLRDQLGQ